MKALFIPAIKLINMMRYAYKFTLISLLFYIPLFVTSYLIVDVAYKSILAADYKSQGVAIVGHILKIKQHAEYYRDNRIVSALYTEDEFVSKRSRNKARIDDAIFDMQSEGFELLENPVLVAQLDVLLARSKKLDVDLGIRTPDLKTLFENNNVFIEELVVFYSLVVEASGLGAESDAQVTGTLGL
ncbi:MAG: hypothetical protein KUG73_11455, partial [Pseudomonadales bacterium]|nr:hypothetical protein [Pseudomonadales bacterium]